MICQRDSVRPVRGRVQFDRAGGVYQSLGGMAQALQEIAQPRAEALVLHTVGILDQGEHIYHLQRRPQGFGDLGDASGRSPTISRR